MFIVYRNRKRSNRSFRKDSKVKGPVVETKDKKSHSDVDASPDIAMVTMLEAISPRGQLNRKGGWKQS
jgi:hypothetical protein